MYDETRAVCVHVLYLHAGDESSLRCQGHQRSAAAAAAAESGVLSAAKLRQPGR